MIKEYEDREWPDFDKVTDSQVGESDKAEEIVNYEQKFINKHKDSIRKKLKEYDMTQQDLGLILGHPKSHMSELINGVSQFTLKDLVIIHRILKINTKCSFFSAVFKIATLQINLPVGIVRQPF